jgi:hypothetical protein
LNRTFSDGQNTLEEMLNIPLYKGNANQNHIKIPPQMPKCTPTQHNKK